MSSDNIITISGHVLRYNWISTIRKKKRKYVERFFDVIFTEKILKQKSYELKFLFVRRKNMISI